VAQLYYEQGLTQAEIANRVHVTRWKVGRLLEEARQTGIVRIEIIHRHARCHAEEKQLKKVFGLEDVVVVPTADGDSANRRNVAAAGAEYLADLRPQPRVVAVSWGQTMDDVADQIPPGWARGVSVVQANGGLNRSGRSPAITASVELARQGVGTALYLPAPAIVESAALGRALSADPSVRRVLDIARGADVILSSVGALTGSAVLVGSGYLTEANMLELRAKGATGDIFARFIDAEGRPVDTDLDARTIGLTADDLRRAKLTINVVSGLSKLHVSLAAIRGGMVKVLICDQQLAINLLDLDAGA
jgi:deoxyribonucleoside regulator